MKNHLFLLLFVLLFASCNGKVEISVFNNSEVDRVHEMVEICLCELTNFDTSKLVILDPDGKQVPYQVLYKGEDTPQVLIFPVTLKAGKEATFIVKEGKPEQFTAKTKVRFVPERKDDISWENDRIGFRMYGPALANENPSNGVDVWLKRTSELVFEKWYKNDISQKASYHQDHGEGLDCYNVGHTLGCGGICPIVNDSLYIGRYFDRYKILDNGPLRSSFLLYYDFVSYGSKNLKAELLITIDAGSPLNEAVIRYTGDTTNIQLAAGIFLQDTVQTVAGSTTQGFIGYAEDAFAQGTKTSAGRRYEGVVFDAPVVAVKQLQNHLIGISNYKVGEPFRYYFGAGWNKFGIKKDSDWFSLLSDKRIALSQPLKVKILK
jgi:hypothetical protein